MQETLHDFHTTISSGGRPLCNLRFADYIELMESSEAEFQDPTNKLEKASKAYGMVNSSSQTAATNIMLNGKG